METAARAAFLREQAENCLRLADSLTDWRAAAELRNMAMKFQLRAKLSEQTHGDVALPKMEPPVRK